MDKVEIVAFTIQNIIVGVENCISRRVEPQGMKAINHSFGEASKYFICVCNDKLEDVIGTPCDVCVHSMGNLTTSYSIDESSCITRFVYYAQFSDGSYAYICNRKRLDIEDNDEYGICLEYENMELPEMFAYYGIGLGLIEAFDDIEVWEEIIERIKKHKSGDNSVFIKRSRKKSARS